MKIMRKTVLIITIISSLLSLIIIAVFIILPRIVIWKYTGNPADAGSIGIIGSADGPTRILVSGAENIKLYFIIPMLFAMAGVIFLFATSRGSYKKS